MDRTLLSLLVSLALFTPATYATVKYPDELEDVNRGIYLLNKFADSLYAKPAAVAYETVIPYPARASARNFFNNMNDFPVIVNDILRGKIVQAGSDIMRVAVNSTLGILGLFDVATPLGFERHQESLGKTFYHWGWTESNYFIIPFVGPSTIRDAIGLVGDLFLTPAQHFKAKARNPYYGWEYVDRRATFQNDLEIIGVAGVNDYDFLRSTYFQHRMYVLNDGKPGVYYTDDLDMLGEPPQ